MQIIISFIKRHKVLLTVAVILLLVLVVLIVNSKQITRPIPVKVEPQSVFDPTVFKLENTSPPSGKRTTIDSFEYIYFTFSKPVDASKVSIYVYPLVKLKATVFAEKNVLVIMPENDYWKEDTEYQITINNINSQDGKALGSSIKYIYLNLPPTDITTGENF